MRTAAHPTRTSVLDPSAVVDRLVGLRRVAPAGRLLWPAVALLVLALLQLGVRVGHSQSTAELRTHLARTKDAVTARERLRLELAVRSNDPHLREVASRFALVAPASTVVLPEPEVRRP